MNYKEFNADFPLEFREAFEDLDMSRIAGLLDNPDLAEIGRLVWMNIDAAKESIEDDLPSERDDCSAHKEHRDLNPEN